MESQLQKVTSAAVPEGGAAVSVVDQQKQELLKWQYIEWVKYNAVGGMIVQADGDLNLKQINVSEFAQQINVSRKTLYEWRKREGFWDLVKQYRLHLGGKDRLAKVYNGLFLKAAAGNTDAIKLYLQIFDDWKPPRQEHEVEVTHSVTALLEKIQKRKLIQSQQASNAATSPAASTPASN